MMGTVSSLLDRPTLQLDGGGRAALRVTNDPSGPLLKGEFLLGGSGRGQAEGAG